MKNGPRVYEEIVTEDTIANENDINNSIKPVSLIGILTTIIYMLIYFIFKEKKDVENQDQLMNPASEEDDGNMDSEESLAYVLSHMFSVKK